ncbi:polysaccharide deacetylase family protein [Microbulbifer sp. 2304DJ12-6]|uniref:polysaccharide deacetylase family protein n=1 Tax=Microbulbifer sp. 2304DJ12-6 TaxID=3233340 RepID=UPI0039AEF900
MALVFGEGPVPGATESLLKRLGSPHIKATFFPLGREMGKHPKQTRAIIAAGHQLGNHGYSHINLANLPLSSAKEEIKNCTLLQRHGHQERPMILPPFVNLSEKLRSLLAEQKFLVAQWDLEPRHHAEWKTPETAL